MTALSILDLVRVTEDTDARGALDNARDIAVHAEAWGYRRIWVAEHHNMPGIASAATSVVIGHIAAGTKTIRVGAGGIMLPNHAPYVIAEQFGTLAQLFPGRIDLGLGRAPGTDQLTPYGAWWVDGMGPSRIVPREWTLPSASKGSVHAGLSGFRHAQAAEVPGRVLTRRSGSP